MPKRPPKPPSKAKKPPTPPKPEKISYDPFARTLAQTVADAHGVDQAATFDMSEELAAPRGFIGTRNIALERALGGGIPLGRLTEISGWEGSGKSTMLDQLFAQCHVEGGIGAIADTERTRNRPYMRNLGVQDKALVWIGGKTCEMMFSQVETLAKKSAALNCVAWVEALRREKIKVPKPKERKHVIYSDEVDGNNRRKKLASFKFPVWGREQAAALLEFQKAHGLPAYGIRDTVSREVLRPCVLYGTDSEQGEALAAWQAGDPHPMVEPADRPILIGWDSVAATATEAELDGDARDVHPASAARVIRLNFRRLIQLIDDEAIAFVLVNQRYQKFGRSWGGATLSETYGGGGIKYHTTLRIEVKRREAIYNTAADKKARVPPIGQVVEIGVPKNKIESPFHTERFGLIFGHGADNAWAIYEDLKSRGIITQGGAWSKFADTSIGAGRSFHGWQGLSNMMAADPALYDRLADLYLEGR